RPYGVDLMLTGNFVDPTEGQSLDDLLPPEHVAFLDDMMDRYQVPETASDRGDPQGRLGETRFTAEQNAELIEAMFRHNPKVFVSALGTPPAEVVARAHDRGMLVGALAGKGRHAVYHQKAGLDFVVATSAEAGGHVGDIGSMVLIPEVVDAVAPLPVLAAGGIGGGRQMAAAMAMGAQGVWCGSLWLTTVESDTLPLVKDKLLAANSDQTARTTCFTGKYARFLKTDWSDEWGAKGAPEPLGAPLQTHLVGDYIQRIYTAAGSGQATPESGAGRLISSPVGQIVGAINTTRSSRDVVREMVDEFAEAVSRLSGLVEDA
ncbi:MAG: nitronate monooxygenase family protein, partial [Alphaproteobacteria bacterium]|nr:nitronate monooxygenase family protein [Alphaproteobacteria bacterium]